MNRENFTQQKKKIFFCMVVYGLLCEVFSLFILGFRGEFTIGLILGMGAAAINLVILETVVDLIIKKRNTWLAFLIHLGRFFLFGLLAVVSLKISFISVVAYAIGVLGRVVGSLVTFVKKEG